VEIAANPNELLGDNFYKINKTTALTEKGNFVNGRGDTPNQHDMLTGSQRDGTVFPAGEDKTCHNWTSRQRNRWPHRPDRQYAGPELLELLPQHARL